MSRANPEMLKEGGAGENTQSGRTTLCPPSPLLHCGAPRYRILKLSPLQNGKWWVVLEDVTAAHGVDGHVPRGFTTDFASTPRPLWWLLPPYGRYGAAAINHDRDYHLGIGTRRAADHRFLDAMARQRVLLGVRYAMWAAVRLFGWLAWKSNEIERELGGCSLNCSPRCCRVLNPVPEHQLEPRPRGIERLLHWVHGRAA